MGFKETVKKMAEDSKVTIEKAEAFAKCPYNEGCDIKNCSCAKYKAYKKGQDPKAVEEKLNELGIDVNSDPWEILMKMQKMFASKFHKVDNLSKDEVDHWQDKYLICVEDELREVREHLCVYNDITKEDDVELKKEIIDILHFIMDLFICGNSNAEDIKKAYLKKYSKNVKEVHNFLGYAYELQELQSTFDGINSKYVPSYDDDLEVLVMACKLSDAGAKVRREISWKHWKKPSETINQEKLNEAFADMFKCLMDMFVFVFDSAEEIKDIYIKKNMENIFRQEFGY